MLPGEGGTREIRITPKQIPNQLKRNEKPFLRTFICFPQKPNNQRIGRLSMHILLGKEKLQCRKGIHCQ